MRIYLDTCCINRPFDSASQNRITVEAEAVLQILSKIESGDWDLVVSDAVLFELRRISDTRRRDACLAIAALSSHHERIDEATVEKAKMLTDLGFGKYDAVHLTLAVASKCDIFLTVDDRLLRRAEAFDSKLGVKVANPVIWLATVEDGGST